MLQAFVALAVLGTITIQEQLDGTEIGDANQYIAFNSGGGYHAEREGPKGKTTARGTWAVKDDTLEVKIDACKGPACNELGKGYTAKLQLVAERAMTVSSSFNQGPLSSGSYYCRFQGCEKRTGVLLVTHGAKANVMKYLVDFLVDQNRTRDVTVVWWGAKTTAGSPTSQITWCPREEKRGKDGAQLVAKDLALLKWFGKVEPRPESTPDCLYDVKVLVGDDVKLPPKR